MPLILIYHTYIVRHIRYEAFSVKSYKKYNLEPSHMFYDSLLSELNVLRNRREGSLTASPDPNDVVYMFQLNIGGERLNLDFDLEVQIFKLLSCYLYGKILTAVIVRSSHPSFF